MALHEVLSCVGPSSYDCRHRIVVVEVPQCPIHASPTHVHAYGLVKVSVKDTVRRIGHGLYSYGLYRYAVYSYGLVQVSAEDSVRRIVLGKRPGLGLAGVGWEGSGTGGDLADRNLRITVGDTQSSVAARRLGMAACIGACEMADGRLALLFADAHVRVLEVATCHMYPMSMHMSAHKSMHMSAYMSVRMFIHMSAHMSAFHW